MRSKNRSKLIKIPPAKSRTLSTGYKHLDSIVKPMKPGSVVFISGEKDSPARKLALNIAVNMAHEQAHPTAFFTFDSQVEVVMHEAILTKLDIQDWSGSSGRNPTRVAWWKQIREVVESFEKNAFFLSQECGLSSDRLREKYERLKAYAKLRCIFIDAPESLPVLASMGRLPAFVAGLMRLGKELGVSIFLVGEVALEAQFLKLKCDVWSVGKLLISYNVHSTLVTCVPLQVKGSAGAELYTYFEPGSNDCILREVRL